jgi:pimeloyl-ACP methyl ester carboxylesterase
MTSVPIIVNTGFDKAKAKAVLASGNADLVAFGVPYIANPDLVARLRSDASLNKPDPTTFYASVLGSMGIYRAAFASIDQTEPLMAAKITLPVVALGGEKGLGDKVGTMVAMVAEDVEAHTLAGCGHFMTEERPQFVIDQILKLSARVPAEPPATPIR